MITLPIDPFLADIAAAVRRGPGLVIVAEPGAGKTTRVPRALLEQGLGDHGEIVVLEPRRIATRMAARRVAEELGEEVGERVGYTVRFEDVGSARTRLRFITEGVLTRRWIANPHLQGTSVVVLDEFHERSLHADLGIAMLRELQRSGARDDLRIVVMSATIDARAVADFLGADVIEVPGRRYDVAIEHAKEPDERPLERRIAAATKRALREESTGHVLVFLPGAAEIRRAKEAIGTEGSVEVLPLHGDLPPADQDRAVRPSKTRKVILATNVAETSLTIDDVSVVIDSGLARAARHSPWSGLPTLSTVPICKASATQRAGRAGRTRAGRAIRLYTQHDLESRPLHDAAEIQRIDLAETVLALSAREHDARSFSFFESPPRAAIEAAQRLLALLGAIDPAGRITSIGSAMLALPIHPRLARVLLFADAHGERERAALLVALLADRDLRQSMRTQIGHGKHAGAESGTSDALARLELFEEVEYLGLDAARLRAHDMDVGGSFAVARARDQLLRAIDRVGVRNPKTSTQHDRDDVLLRALLMGFPDRVAKRRRAHHPEVLLAGGGSAKLSEQSVVRDASLMVAIDAEERRGGIEVRTASGIEPEWLLELTPDAIEAIDEVRFDSARERIERISAIRYLGLSIDESKSDPIDVPNAAGILATAAIQRGIEHFVDRGELEQLQRRLAEAHRIDPSVPLIDAARIDRVVHEAAIGRRSFDELKSASILELLIQDVGRDVVMRLDRIAPSHVTLPGRARVPVHYEADRPPWIESRMQDFCGLREGPRVGDRALVLHLLAPNQRAVQVTTDLSGFWQRHYPALRKELMRRYPRQAWPEDPTIPLPPKPARNR